MKIIISRKCSWKRNALIRNDLTQLQQSVDSNEKLFFLPMYWTQFLDECCGHNFISSLHILLEVIPVVKFLSLLCILLWTFCTGHLSLFWDDITMKKCSMSFAQYFLKKDAVKWKNDTPITFCSINYMCCILHFHCCLQLLLYNKNPMDFGQYGMPCTVDASKVWSWLSLFARHSEQRVLHADGLYLCCADPPSTGSTIFPIIWHTINSNIQLWRTQHI